MTNEKRQESPTTIQSKITILLEIIKRFDNYILSTNAKASLIIVFNSIVLGTVLVKWTEIMGFYQGEKIRLIIGILLFAITALSLFSLWFVFRVVFPYFGSRVDEIRQKSSVFFFGSVADMNNSEYSEKMSAITLDELLADLSTQVRVVATGLNEKMSDIRTSIGALRLTLVFVFLMAALRAYESFI